MVQSGIFRYKVDYFGTIISVDYFWLEIFASFI